MTINWRKTAGGVEIAEHEDMTAIVYLSGYVEVLRAGTCRETCRDYQSPHGGKQWFEHKYCRPKYTVTKYPDGGEVYASEDGQRVAMVTMSNSMYWTELGNGAGEFQDDCESAVKAAIAYVSKETA